MAAFFGQGSRSRGPLNDDTINHLLQDGNLSEIEDLDDDDVEFDADVLFSLAAEENISGEEEDDDDDEPNAERSLLPPSLVLPPVMQPPPSLIPTAASRASRSSRRGRSVSVSNKSSRSTVSTRGRAAVPRARVARNRIWKQGTFCDKQHDYPVLPTKPVRQPVEYFKDYMDTEFFEKISLCTNLYYLRTTGRELKSTSTEISKLFAIHIIMGCIPYPRVPMYWRAGTKLGLICELMTRNRFLTLRNALHVIDSDTPAECEKDNPLWKVQPMINKVKDTCNKLERVPGFYSIDEQMIPFSGRCKLRQVVRNKPQPDGLKNFVLTTSEGLMLDFEIYKGAQTKLGDSDLGLGPSVILHLIKSVPPGSCVYHDRYFTTVTLIEEMEKLNLHPTGTIMQNRIPNQASIKFKKDSQMARGETQQFVCNPTAVVKWKDNKSVLLASNCTAAEETSNVKRWDKKQKVHVDVSAPKIVSNYNKYMGGVDILDQQMEYYRTFIKTKKWTLKVLIHFLDLSLVNSWRLYKNDCLANGLPRKDTMALLDFRLDVADSLSCVPGRARIEEDEENLPPVVRRDYKIYRPANAPSESKRYDGYEHYPTSDNIKAPRTCRMEDCDSRSKIRCEKCDVYLCLSRDKNCFKSYHRK